MRTKNDDTKYRGLCNDVTESSKSAFFAIEKHGFDNFISLLQLLSRKIKAKTTLSSNIALNKTRFSFVYA